MITNKRVWSNLEFILTDIESGTTLHLGENSKLYPSISKNEEMFNSLLTFPESESEGREIPITLNLKNMRETEYLNSFLNPAHDYNLKVIKDGANYYSKCSLLKSSVDAVDDLYNEKPTQYTINLKLLDNWNFFESDPAYSNSVGYTMLSSFCFGVAYPLDIKDYKFSVTSNLQPVVIHNQGGDNIGFELKIKCLKSIKNPILKNITTGYQMQILIEAKGGDELIIDTREKTVSLNGVYYENVKKIQDNWLRLQLGYNIVKFDADAGANGADCILTYRNKYRGF